ncbi:MAG TPA: hypothetical protein VM243_12950, partial [Phycisphaerae bacterium]|nr:hypothetical protein [Phycisphaerae bacterium]
SAAQTHTAVQASPAPVDADARQDSDKSTRPSTQPANAESTDAQSPDPASTDTRAPSVPEPTVPQCLSLSIETSMDACPSEEADERFWMLLDPVSIPVSNDDEFGPPPLESVGSAFESSPAPLSSETPTETS